MFTPQDIKPYWTTLPPQHPLSQEMRQWEKPYRYEEFPKMVYRARPRPDGIVTVVETNDARCAEPGNPVVMGAADQWSRGNYMTVNSKDEFTRAIEAGWRPTPEDALALYHSRETAKADEAAHRNWLDRNMSEKAKAEAAEREGDGSKHVPEIPEAPRVRRKPGPKPKTTPEAA